MHYAKVAKALWQIPPWNACPVAIQHRFDEKTVVPRRPAYMSFPPGKKILDALPLIVPQSTLTGWGSEEDRRRTREAGFNCHLTKPIQLASIDILLQSAFTGHLASTFDMARTVMVRFHANRMPLRRKDTLYRVSGFRLCATSLPA